MDGDFSDSDWTSTLLIDTTPAPGATFSVQQPAAGGTPGAYRETRHDYLGGSIQVAHVHGGAVADPSALGGISSVSFSYDLIHLGDDPYAVRYRLLLIQDGKVFTSVPGDLIFTGGWQSFVHAGLGESDFVINTELDTGTENPDFSVAGAPIQFGYRTSNYASALDPQTRISGIDNWTVVVSGGAVSVESTSWTRVKSLYR